MMICAVLPIMEPNDSIAPIAVFSMFAYALFTGYSFYRSVRGTFGSG